MQISKFFRFQDKRLAFASSCYSDKHAGLAKADYLVEWNMLSFCLADFGFGEAIGLHHSWNMVE